MEKQLRIESEDEGRFEAPLDEKAREERQKREKEKNRLIREARQNWEQEKERNKLDEKVEDAQNSVRARMWYWTLGMLFGFLIEAVGAISYLSTGLTRARRVVGGVVISAQLLLIFLAFVLNSTISTLVLRKF